MTIEKTQVNNVVLTPPPPQRDIMDSIIKFINGVGFPIAMCIALFYTNYDTLKNQNELLAQFKDSIQTNNKAVAEITTVLYNLNNEVSKRSERADHIINEIETINKKLDTMQANQ